MRFLCLMMIVFAFGCSEDVNPKPGTSSNERRKPLVTLEQMTYVGTSRYQFEHPLVCGVGRDFPAGMEKVFKQGETGEHYHVVFPRPSMAPETLDGTFLLRGYFKVLENFQLYTFKKPSKSYKYFVVSSWKRR